MTDTDICNLALGHLGHSVEIATNAVLTERSKAARVFRRILSSTRQEVLRDFPWSFATGFAELTLIEEDPTNEWAFSYRLPADCVRARRVFADIGRKQGLRKRVAFRVVSDLYSTAWAVGTTYAAGDYASVTTAGVTVWYLSRIDANVGLAPDTNPAEWSALAGSPPAVLYTDQENATIEYTRLITDPNLYPADFAQAFALLLAVYAAPSLTGDNEELGKRALGLYRWRRDGASKNDAEEEQVDPEPDSPSIEARN